MVVLGLTGGIASGKSTAVRWFLEHGIPVVDADQVVRELQQPGGLLLLAIQEAFGPGFILADGTLDRKALGQLIFNDPAAKKKLDGISHPLVEARLQEEVARWRQQDAALLVLDVPLLFEAGLEKMTDLTAVVHVPFEVQLSRLMKRDGIDEDYARSKIASQASLDEKRAKADFVLDNGGDPLALTRQLTELYGQLIQ